MNLKHLHDSEILNGLRSLVQNERDLLMPILQHLREVETRKLFSDLKYQSLFEYCVKELKYSEGQAGRRIQAMRLLRELPQLENKIQSGTLSLSNLSQAQSYFREKAKTENVKTLSPSEKTMVLEKLENTSSRETEKILITLSPHLPLPKEKERPISESHTEVRFVMDEDLKNKLQKIRTLLGPKAINMSFAELVQAMAEISSVALSEKKFGKKNMREESTSLTPAPELLRSKTISKTIKHRVWKKDRHACSHCGSQHNLNIDHIKPKALGGSNDFENLRLLCFHCNQRQAFLKLDSIGLLRKPDGVLPS